MLAKQKCRISAFTVILTLSIATAAAAQQCATLLKGLPAAQIDALDDGQLLQFSNGVWKQIPPGDTIGLPGQKLRLFYVVRDLSKQIRSGVLIFKTARTRSAEDFAAPRDIQLSREPRHVDNTPCGAVERFPTRPVPSDSYDIYHDEGRAVAAQKDLDAFHFNYVGRRRGCRLTNDHNPDGLFDLRTNRGQYSFDKDVVGRQTWSQILALLGPSRAFASSCNLQDQRVEVKQYTTIANAPACVGFTVRVAGPASFLRINDLEGLTLFGNRFYRSPEREWALSP